MLCVKLASCLDASWSRVSSVRSCGGTFRVSQVELETKVTQVRPPPGVRVCVTFLCQPAGRRGSQREAACRRLACQ